jgi:histone deacetylase complex regulatory component SIN3
MILRGRHGTNSTINTLPFLSLPRDRITYFDRFSQNQVYLQVQMLFKEAPDLILEFKNFLPEAVNGGAQQQDAAQMMANQIWSQQQQQAPPSPQPTKKLAPAKRKKRTDKEPTPVPAPKVAPSRVRIRFIRFFRERGSDFWCGE